MSSAYEYTMLISGLPKIDHWSDAKRSLISPFQIRNRFRSLSFGDALDLEILIALLDFDRWPFETSDEEYLRQCSFRLSQLNNTDLRALIVWRLEFRTIVAALRHKRIGNALLTLKNWGYGRWTTVINSHWQDNYLGLSKIFPWVIPLVDALAQNNALEAEKIGLDEIWNWLNSMSLGHEFDLQAVAIYWMRWDIASNWTTSVVENEQKITFEKLLNQTLSVKSQILEQ